VATNNIIDEDKRDKFENLYGDFLVTEGNYAKSMSKLIEGLQLAKAEAGFPEKRRSAKASTVQMGTFIPPILLRSPP